MALRLTEQPSLHDNLEKKSVAQLLREINEEDKKVPLAIEQVLPDLEKLVTAIENTIRNGGRMFYLGCGTGGKIAVLDMLEIPNTYGVPKEMFQCVLAGGVENLVLDLEEAEDDIDEGWITLENKHHVTSSDIVVGISASGNTPYVLAALMACREHGIPTGSFVNNPNSPISKYSDYPVEVLTGPEFITGSTRMKSGTSQKLICDMISTTVMCRLGRVEGNRMVHAHLINNKVIDRLTRTLMERNNDLTDYSFAEAAIKEYGGLKEAEAALIEKGVIKAKSIKSINHLRKALLLIATFPLLWGCARTTEALGATKSQCPVVINEIAPHDDYEETDTWVELMNPSNSTVDISGMGLYLYDQYFNGKEIYKAAVGTKLASGQRLVLSTSDNALITGISSSSDFKLVFGESKDRIADHVSRKTDLCDKPVSGFRASYQRIPDGTGEWRSLTYPSRGKANKLFDISKTKSNAIWVWGSHMASWLENDAAVLKEMKAKGYDHVMLNSSAFEYAKKNICLKFIQVCEDNDIVVHAWVQCFYNSGAWINPIDVANKCYKEDIYKAIVAKSKSYIDDFGVKGLHLDYIRFGGTASKHFVSSTVNGTEAVTRMCRMIKELLEYYGDENLVSSAAMMPEMNSTDYYGQSPDQMGKYIDIFMPMIYRYNYHYSDDMCRKVANWFVDHGSGAQCWAGIQTYEGDDKVVPLSTESIRKDCELFAATKATGIVLFRYGLGIFPDVNDLWNK